MTLLVGALGPVGAEVMIVVMAAIAGSTIALAGDNTKSFWQAIRFMLMGILVALILSWALSGLLISYIPALASPYTPSIIALLIGYGSDRLPNIFNSVIGRVTKKVQGK